MARKKTQQDEEIIDLTELIEEGPGRGGNKAASSPPAGDDDFGDLLAQTQMAEHGSDRAADHPVDPNEQLDMSGMGGIDNLLETLDIPPQPRESAPQPVQAPEPAPAPAPSGNDEDLESVLDDLLGGDISQPKPNEKQTPPPASQPEVNVPDLNADLDDILSSFEDRNAAAKPAPAADDLNLDADLDNILSSIGDEEKDEEKKDAAPASKSAPETEEHGAGGKAPDENPAAGLDDLLSSPETSQKKQSPDSDLDLDNVLAQMETPPMTEAAAEKSGVSSGTAQKPAGDDFQLPPDLDDMLDEEAKVSLPEEGTGEIPVQKTFKQNELSDTPEFLARDALQVRPPAELSAQPTNQELIADICRNILGANAAAIQETMRDFSSRLGAQTAHLQDLASNVENLTKRLLACEARMGAAKGRIVALETAMKNTSSMEDLFREGSSLNNGFTTLIASAIARALEGVTSQNQLGMDFQDRLDNLSMAEKNSSARMATLEERLGRLEGSENSQSSISHEQISAERVAALEEKLAALEAAATETLEAEVENSLNSLELAGKSAAARMDSIEKRLDDLEPNFNIQVEKAAAAAVARILHEEINHLLEGK